MSAFGSKADIWGAGGIAEKKNPSRAERRGRRSLLTIVRGNASKKFRIFQPTAQKPNKKGVIANLFAE
jgi:hypothetical protein